MIRISVENAEEHNIGILLQKGVYVEKPDAITVSGFICLLLDITPEEAAASVRTIFLDNKVVDDPVGRQMEGDHLVLSGAMPGLVGAMLRSGSPYGAMRASITAEGVTNRSSQNKVRLKLLNTVLSKYKQRLVDHGFWIEKEDE